MGNLDMSLDDLITLNKKKKKLAEGRFGAPHFGTGPSRRFPNRFANRTPPYFIPSVQAPETKWKHDMFAEHAVASPALDQSFSSVQIGTELFVSNLDYEVTDEDIKELFSDVGNLKKYSIYYDKSGRSKGIAKVVFSQREDAEAAIKRHNNIQLDGKPMKIEIAGTVTATAALMAPLYYSNGPRGGGTYPLAPKIYAQTPRTRAEPTRWYRNEARRGGTILQLQSGNRSTRGSKHYGEKASEKLSTEDLDADLDKYHTEAMKTN